MNIKITYNWLKEYLDTDADPYEIQKYLSLCGPSVETVEKAGDDYVFDIEVTSNRVDTASVFGIAQEAQAILPQFGKKAVLKKNPFAEYVFGEDLKGDTALTVNIKDKSLATRVAAIVLSGARIGPSPELIRRRLELCDIRPINNIVDVTNYVMIALGQPAHVFDYDAIGGHTLNIRESKKGEKVTTLDNREITLPGGDIVIEDGTGKLIDLCGIMGGLNSAVTENTKNVVLFIQTYDKRRIRRTSMTTGQRSVAATYFEKGLDEERVEPAVMYAIRLLRDNAGAAVASDLTDIFPSPYKATAVTVSQDFIIKRIGVDILAKTSQDILERLGFGVKYAGGTYTVSVPPSRKYDVAISEDIVEEIARIYGYHNLPNVVQTTQYIQQPREFRDLFAITDRIKAHLKHLGLHESVNYSMISREQIESLQLDPAHHLEVANSISEELQYMRVSLLPSLIRNIRDNQGKRDALKFFEIAKVYYPQKDDLPKEVYKAAIAVNSTFADLKGIIESLLLELNIGGITQKKGAIPIFSESVQVDFLINGGVVGSVGKLRADLGANNGMKGDVYLASFDVLTLMQNTRQINRYVPINPFATIKLDLTVALNGFTDFVNKSSEKSKLLDRVEYLGSFADKVNLRLYFTSTERNITDKEAAAELEKIKELV